MIELQPLGDRSFLATFANDHEPARWAAAVLATRLPGVLDVVPAYRSVAVHADPERIDLDGLEALLRELEPARPADDPGGLHLVPTLYDGPDLAEVAARLGLDATGVIDAHSGREYHVFAVGFLPGFPYAGYLQAPIEGLPRRECPRPRVPAGAVAIAGRQTAIYPQDSPGGWLLIGRTPLRIADLASGHFPIKAGDWLRFVPITLDEFDRQQGNSL